MERLVYREDAPTPHLGHVIRCIWSLRGPASLSPESEPIVPDGCMELVLNFADAMAHEDARGVVVQPTLLAVGQTTGPVRVRPTGRIDLVGIRLQPWAAPLMLRASASELRDRLIDLRDVRPALARRLGALLDDPPPPEARCALVQQAIERSIVGAHDARSARGLVDMIVRSRMLPSVAEMSSRSGLAVRAVQRAFASDVGLSPKSFVRIVRVQRALRLARSTPSMSWSRIASSAGYFDQSHFVRDFRALVGCSPTNFPRPLGEVVDLTAALIERGEPFA